MTKSKTKTKVILMEPINSLKTIILGFIAFSHLVNTKLCCNDFIFKHLLIFTFTSVFKGLGRVTENFVIIYKGQPNYFENFFFIYNILMEYLSLIIINFQNVPFYLYNYLFQEGQKNFVKNNILKHISIKQLPV